MNASVRVGTEEVMKSVLVILSAEKNLIYITNCYNKNNFSLRSEWHFRTTYPCTATRFWI